MPRAKKQRQKGSFSQEMNKICRVNLKTASNPGKAIGSDAWQIHERIRHLKQNSSCELLQLIIIYV